jgi:hypothetical protein
MFAFASHFSGKTWDFRCFQIVFKMSFIADKYCDMYLVASAAENNAALAARTYEYAMRFPNA